MSRPHRLVAATGAFLVAALVLATSWRSALDDAARDVTSFSERQLPFALLVVVLASAAVVPLGVLALSHDLTAAAGLTLAGTAVLLPLVAAWPELDARWRALALAVGPLAVAGLALMARSWVGASLAGSAGVLHALAYDPFRDVGCARVCLEAAPALAMPTDRLTLLVALASTTAAGLALRSAWARRDATVTAAAGAVALAALAVVRWRTVGESDAYADIVLAAVPVPGLVALSAVAAWTRARRQRSAVRRLAQELAEDPASLLELGHRVDASLLSPGQQLALRNAQLTAEASARLAEVRASQRRVVAAADAERQRIERDLHDGTQQRLVGVLMHVSGQGLDEVEHQLRGVLAELRSFSHHTFPPVLEHEGLEVALAALAAELDAELRLDVRLGGPVPPEQARAVYALACLATTGVIDLHVVSREDGLDVALVGPVDVDLGDVEDRFGALGGTLTATAERIEGRLPCAW